MKNKYHIVGAVLKILSKNLRSRVNIHTSNVQIHEGSYSWLGTSTSIKSDKAKLVSWVQTKKC